VRIVVADSAGFCMGVRRAVNMVLELVEQTSEPICSIGPLIHNPQVVELLRQRGVRPAQSLEEIDKGIIVIRSHGISPAARAKLEARGLKILDATCPRVARVHRAVEKYSRLGFLVVVLGDPGHSEVEGILGFANGKAVVIQSAADVKNLPEAERVILVAQTTQSNRRFEQAAEAMRQRYAHLPSDRLLIINTICDSTERKQEEVRELASKVDAFVVVGGKESANTRRLKEIAESEGKPAYLVESEDELDFEKLRGLSAVGLTAGASTPNWMLRRVFEQLKRVSLAGQKFPLQLIYRSFRMAAVFNFYLGAGGALLCGLASQLLQGQLNWFACLAAFFYLSSIHNFHVLANQRLLEIIEPARGKFFLHHRRGLVYLSLAGLVLGAVFAFLINAWALLFYAGLGLLSLLYQAPFGSGEKPGRFRVRSLMDIPGSKDLFSALAWSVMIVLIPLSGAGEEHTRPLVWLIFALIFLMVLARSVIQDFRDLQADRIVGKETIPILLGVNFSRAIIHSVIALAALLLLAGFARGLLGLPGAGIVAGLAWLWLCVPVFTRKTLIQGMRAELFIDFSFILAGGLGLVLAKL